ncbi:hypothetical protein [Nocardia thailandica]
MCYQPKPATPRTAQVNRDAAARYDLADVQDFADAKRGLIAELPGNVGAADGSVIFAPHDFDWIEEGAAPPDSVNPSLWRQSQLIKLGGLYQVTDRIYQVRNNDIANLTVIEGDDGLVVVDCMAGWSRPGRAWS